MAQSCLVDLPRRRAGGVDNYEPDGAPDGRVCAMTRAEHAHAGVDADFGDHRPAHYHQNRRAHCAGRDRVEIKFRFAHRFNSRGNNREVFWTTPGHHCVDGDLFGGYHASFRWLSSDNIGGRTVGRVKKLTHSVLTRRHDWQTIGPTSVKVIFYNLRGVVKFEYSRCQVGHFWPLPPMMLASSSDVEIGP